MDTIFDYIRWMGDISFSEKAFGEVDSVILSMLSYIDFNSVGNGEDISFKAADEEYCTNEKYAKTNFGLIIPSRQIKKMFSAAAKSRRFEKVVISDAEARTSIDGGYQFACMTCHLNSKFLAVVFRGTDDSIVGWREDCNLAFVDEIPAQRMAVEYIEEIANKYPKKKIYVMGHSKGGNLSLYSAVKSDKTVRERIVRAYCNDGPGLSLEIVNSVEFKAMQRRLTVLLPQSSLIGIMFEKGEKYTVIESKGIGFIQHDPYTWSLEGPKFVRLPSLSAKGKKNEEVFKARMAKMTRDEKQQLVDAFFDILESTGAKTLTDFTQSSHKKIVTLVKNYGKLDKNQRGMLTTLAKKLFNV